MASLLRLTPLSSLSSAAATSPPPASLRLSLRPNAKRRLIAVTYSSRRNSVRFPALDRRASSHLRLRFARKLTSLLLSKRLHFLPLRVLRRCRAYLRPSRPILRMALRYPTLFRLLRSPSSGALAVALTPEALSLALLESSLRSRISSSHASKLQKLLLLSPRRLLPLSKLAHLAPDLGLPRRFHSSLLPLHPDLFRTVPGPRGGLLQLLSHDPALALPLPPPRFPSPSPPPIIDRPPRFTPVRLPRGLNLKRRHADFLERFAALPEVNPYAEGPPGEGLGERRACAVVREVLAMLVERRTLVDNLTHFRREFGLPNKLRAMLVRHPELFYVSVKGVRHSVFLVEGYDERGRPREEDELVMLRARLAELVREGKRIRREMRLGIVHEDGDSEEEEPDGDWGLVDEEGFSGDLEDYLFQNGVEEDWEDWKGLEEGDVEKLELGREEIVEFWRMKDGVEGLDIW